MQTKLDDTMLQLTIIKDSIFDIAHFMMGDGTPPMTTGASNLSYLANQFEEKLAELDECLRNIQIGGVVKVLT